MMNPVKIILVYHGIGDDNKFLEVSEDSFKQQINYLFASGFKFLPIQQILKSKAKSVTIVFDDGLSSISEVVSFLEIKNIPFAVSLLIDKIANVEQKYLNIDKILKFKNCEFYSHGIKHIDLTSLSQEELKKEISISKNLLETKLKQKINTFVYPFGTYNKEVLRIVKKAGYDNALGLLPFHLSSRSHKFCLPRLNINGHVNFSKFKFLVSKLGNLYLHLAFLKRKILGQSYLK